MNLIEEKKQIIETSFLNAVEKAREFNDSLMEMRNIELPNLNELNDDEKKLIIQMGRDLDMRVAFILRSLLSQHGNVLFL
jgi:hypothetical protein